MDDPALNIPHGNPHGTGPASDWITRWSHLVPAGAVVLDVAAGAGRHSRWFAERGCQVSAVDRDPAALSLLPPTVTAVVADIEAGPWPFESESFDALVITNYLWRPLWPHLQAAVKPGGLLLMETFALGHERHGRPANPNFLLRPGELLQVFADWQILGFEDGLLVDPPRRVQRIVVRRPRPFDPQDAVEAPLHCPLPRDLR
jgi:SAM-dependent methyltransferase